MAREQLFNFKYDGDTVWVYTGESSNNVFYSINNGDSKSAGIRYNSDEGYFVRTSGKTLLFKDAQAFIRNLLQ